MSRYKILLLDHDDTVVQSTHEIHYPAWVEILQVIRPNLQQTEEDFCRLCYDPGFHKYCVDVLRFSKDEIDFDYQTWVRYATNIIPHAYPGIKELLLRHKADGGKICISTHSEARFVARDYDANFGFQPDDIFGTEYGKNRMKPNPYCIDVIMEKYHVSPQDILMVDDMRHGYDMARQRQVDFAFVAWSSLLPEACATMKKEATHYCARVADLSHILFD